MWYLFLQIWIWLIVAFVLGWFSHWFLCCRGNNTGQDNATSAEQPEAEAKQAGETYADDDESTGTAASGKD